MTIESTTLQANIEHYFAAGAEPVGDREAMDAFLELRNALSTGQVRAAEPDSATPLGWRVNTWVKQGILLGFRLGTLDKWAATNSPSWTRALTLRAGSAWRKQCASCPAAPPSVKAPSSPKAWCACRPCTSMPALTSMKAPWSIPTRWWAAVPRLASGSTLSAAAQIGGVLEPVNATPVIIEDDVLIGGNTGVYEGTLVRRRAVLAAGTILTRGTPVYDIVRGEVLKASADP